jgi:hypothetical protein
MSSANYYSEFMQSAKVEIKYKSREEVEAQKIRNIKLEIRKSLDITLS